ncbi:MAG: c-type cytochrome [Anaerolineae bacterium]|nr:c-type cytochrome [Anaerolineae bacterium]
MKLIQILVGTLVVIATVAALLIAGLGEPVRMAETERAQQARSIQTGASVYETYCTGCHGLKGEGIPTVAPALNSPQFFTQRLKEIGYTGSLRSFIESTVAAGRPSNTQYSAKMPTWSQQFGGPLRPDQVRDVTSFILNWEKTAGTQPLPTPGPTATPLPSTASPEEQGKAVFLADKTACKACHTIDTEPSAKGLVGPNLTHIGTEAGTLVAGQSAGDYIRASIVNPNAFIAPKCPTGPCTANVMPPTFGQQLSQQELDNLVAYLLSLK